MSKPTQPGAGEGQNLDNFHPLQELLDLIKTSSYIDVEYDVNDRDRPSYAKVSWQTSNHNCMNGQGVSDCVHFEREWVIRRRLRWYALLLTCPWPAVANLPRKLVLDLTCQAVNESITSNSTADNKRPRNTKNTQTFAVRLCLYR